MTKAVNRTGTHSPKRLGLADCAELLTLSRMLLWRQWKVGKFAPPGGTANGSPYWHEDQVYQWAATTHPQLLSRIPVRYWPDGQSPATYYGAREIDGAMVQTWQSDTGTVCVVWPLPGHSRLLLNDVAAQLPHADTMICVPGYYGTDGPGLSTAQPGALTKWDESGARWADLARVLGQPAPYWPYQLRIPKLMAAWKPGDLPVTYSTVSDVDNTPLLRLAAVLPQDSPAHKVLLHLARVIQLGSANGALRDLEILAKRQKSGIESGRLKGPTMVVAARPMWVPEFNNEALDEQHRRAGWLEILARTDQLSADCVRIADMWDGGKYFPFSNPEIIDPTTEYGAEWAARLEPMERTAAFEALDSDQCETLTDPETDAPVVRRSDGRLLAVIPQRLATTSPLAEVILDSPIWVRTKDGILYPAPKDSYYGLCWGEYGGAGPGSLALLIHRLLDDITAPGADGTDGAPLGLEKLIETDWRRGTVLTRMQLETARDSHPHTDE